MTWYATSWQHMHQVREQAMAEGKFAHGIAKAIDDSYPFSERSGRTYKAWLAARREFFRRNDLPLRHTRAPAPGLLSEQQP